MENPAIRAEGLGYRYRSAATAAVDGISFSVAPGEIFGLLGPNGAGKTTTVGMLATLLRPGAGRAWITGCEVSEDPLGARRALAAVLQETAVEPLLTVNDNLVLCGKLRGLSGAPLRAAVDKQIAALELEPHLAKVGQELSGGTRRRVQVAKALIVPTPVLFLDEATSGMDPLIKRRVIGMIRGAARDGRAILLTTQLLDEAEALCDRLALVRAGTIAAAGTLAELRARARPLLRMTLAFAQPDPEAAAMLASWPCEERIESEGEWRLTVTGSENEWIARVAELAARHPLSRFELAGADLEQIFVEIYGGHSPTEVAS